MGTTNMATDKIRVVLADDHELLRQGVAHTLRAEPDMEVVGEGDSAAEAIRLACTLLPDLILLDITMPGGGLSAAHAISVACPATRIVMLTVSEEEEDVMGALKAGAHGYVLKGVPARELVRILRSIAAGEGYVTPTLAASLLAELNEPAKGARPLSPLEELTEREREILEGIAAGESNREIGERLHLTEKTIKHYVTNILQKLQVRNRVEAALIAQREKQAR